MTPEPTPPPAPAAPAAPVTGPGARLALLSAGARISVVDDEPLNRHALEDFLRSAGFTVPAGASSGALPDAPAGPANVQRLRDERPDLVLLDLPDEAAPLHDACELLRAMQQDHWLREVPVIVLTAHSELQRRLDALQLGAADFLHKPIDPRELTLRLRNTLAAKAHSDRLAHTDAVTGLPNREATLHRLDWAVKHARRQGSVGAVLQVGLDRFKQVNDALGPSIGDELLRAVALRLQTGLRDTDMVAHTGAEVELSRGGGDEFTVLLPVLARADGAALVAERIAQQMARPFDIAGHALRVGCRIGISVFPGDSADADMVLKHAGAAMHQGRAPGQDASAPTYRFHSRELNTRSLQRLTLEEELHRALDRQELRLHYQPKVCIASGTLSGAEALVRWQHPTRGLLGPGEFIGVAEDCGLISPLGDWVLREALRQLAVWRRRGWDLPQVAVNLASLQLQRPGLCDSVRDALRAAGVNGASLCLELTESAIIDSGPHITQRLHDIKSLGVQIALDDFGTGYSSLSYLHKFPLDEIKIDRSFLAHCGGGNSGDRNSEAIATAIIAMGHGLGLRVVAEGVETQRQLDFIRAQRCDVFQGYLFSRPLPATDYGDLLAFEMQKGDLEVAA